MATHFLRTCRFCKACSSDLLKYSTRAYAHHACFLDAGHKLTELRPWQVAQFPWTVLNQRGLVEEAGRIINAERDRLLANAEKWEREGRLTLARVSRETAASLGGV